MVAIQRGAYLGAEVEVVCKSFNRGALSMAATTTEFRQPHVTLAATKENARFGS